MEKENLPSFLSSQEMSPMQHIITQVFSFPNTHSPPRPVQVVDKIFVLPRYALCAGRWTTRFNSDHLKYFNGEKRKRQKKNK